MNWQVVKDLVAYGRELEKTNDKHFRFTLTTNGVLLNDEVQEFTIKRWTMWCSVWMEEKKSTTECVRLEWKRKL